MQPANARIIEIQPYEVPSEEVLHSTDAEIALVGKILVNGDLFRKVADILKPGDLFLLRHQWIWQTLERLDERQDEIDYLTVLEDLKGRRKLDEIGGAAYLTQLIDAIDTDISVEMLAHMIERAAIRRRMLSAADKIKQLALRTDLTTEQVTRAAETELAEVTTPQQQRDLVTIREAVSQFYDTLEDMQTNGRPQSIPTGLDNLDNLLDGGLFRNKLVYLAGRPSMGKTAAMLTIALNAARLGARVAFFTMEMSQEDCVRRIMAAETGIPLVKLKTGKELTPQDWIKITEALGRLAALKTHLHIDSSPAFTLRELYNKCLLLNAEYGLDLVCVDYIGLMAAPGKDRDEFNKISHLSNGLRWIKNQPEMKASFLVASQLNRNVEARNDKRPILSDLRDSGQLEQDADAVIFLYREKVYNEHLLDDVAEFILAKHRDGQKGTATARFVGDLTKFVNH